MKQATFYKDGIGEWRWRYIDPSNGKILADSGEGYKKKKACEAAYNKVTGADLIQLLKNDLQLCVNTIHVFQSGRKLKINVTHKFD